MLDSNKSPQQLADEYVHGLLTSDEMAMFDKHAEDDEQYRKAKEDAQRRQSEASSVPVVEASEDLVQSTLEAIDARMIRRATMWKVYTRGVLGLATAAALVIAAFNIYYYNLKATPYGIRVMGQESLLSGTQANLRVAVFNEKTGQALADVPYSLTLVNTETQEKHSLGEFKSSLEGEAAQLNLPEWNSGIYELRISAQPEGRTEKLAQSIWLSRKWRLMLSTDKPLYQPGQTIHVRSLALRKPDLTPIADEVVTFTVTDPKGNVIYKTSETGSRFGIAHTDCQLATEIIEGPYQIACQIGDTVSQKTVKVEKYVLPKFKLDVMLDQAFYQPGDTVKGTIAASYFFGKPVTGGEVTIEAYSADVAVDKFASLQEKTNERGKVEFSFELPKKMFGREQNSGDAEFTLYATVTDTAGQQYTSTARRNVTARPIRLEIIPESGTLVKGVPNKVYLFASYPDGQPAVVDVTINGGQITTKTNKLGVAEFELSAENEEPLGLTVKATDSNNRVGRRHVRLAVGTVADDFVLRTDRASYNGGDTIELVALGGGVEPVFVDFMKDGQTLASTRVAVNDGRGELQFDLPAEVFGTIKLVAYRFDKSGLAVRKSRLLFVRQARELQITATFDQPEYRPGATAELTLTLADQDGKPVPGAISLAAVDEAVFAVLTQSRGSEEVFFLLEKELLAPVYAIYDWDPFAQADDQPADLHVLEQAVFSRTATVDTGATALPSEFVSPDISADLPMDDWNGGMGMAEPMMIEEEWVGAEFNDESAPRSRDDVTLAAISDESPFTLAAASYPAKFRDIRNARRHGLQAVSVAWVMFALGLCAMGWVSVLMWKPLWTLIATGLILVLGGVAVAISASMAPHMMAEMATASGMAMGFEAESSDEAVASETMWFGGAGGLGAMGAPRPRVREYFPETLLWEPELITDDAGVAKLTVPLADSITTWRFTASAVNLQGQLGGGEFPVKVFQPFFVDLDLPVALTRNDQVSVPIVVYNYRDAAQTVTLEVADAEWFARLDAAGQPLQENTPLQLELAAGEIRSLHLPIKVQQVGQQKLEVTATGTSGADIPQVADAIRREVEVVADGRRVELVTSGTLDTPAKSTLSLPADAIDGSPRAIVKLYPSTFSQLVEGLDSIFQMPYGCFEQTSSTTYPNVLALDYLRRTDSTAVDVEKKARQYIHLGYQRLVSFEVSGGGFDWFGNPPANRTLTAYGLMEFEDMAAVHDVDPQLIERTRRWLLDQRQPDGSWKAESHMLNDGLASSVNQGDDHNLAATAYIAWAVFGSGRAREDVGATLDYLLAREPAAIDDPYLLAIIANCIHGIEPKHAALAEYHSRLETLANVSEDGKHCHWEQPRGDQTMFYGSGRSGDIETTAMAAMALMRTGQHTATVKRALSWLLTQKDARGTWHSTQATVLALKALIAATDTRLGEDQHRKVEIYLDDRLVQTVEISPDQAEVMQQLNLTEHLRPGEQALTIKEQTNSGVGYQVSYWYHVEDDSPMVAVDAEPLTVNINYDRQQLHVDETVSVTASVTNNRDEAAPMVILDLPIPGGFTIERDELNKLVEAEKIAKYQVTARKVVVYLRGLKPGDTIELNYRLKATMPVKISVPAGQAYEYYNPDHRGKSKPADLEVLIKA